MHRRSWRGYIADGAEPMAKCMFCDCPLPDFKDDERTLNTDGDACPDCYAADQDQRAFEERLDADD